MSLLFECLGNVMVGSPLVEPTLSGRLDRHAQGGIVAAIDIDAFRDVGAFEDDVGALVEAIRALPPAAGVDEILLPGERGDRLAQERRTTGIPLPARIWDELVLVVRDLGVELPLVEVDG
jgi:ureidoglycolate dehydrogenase (NAD+)